MNSTSAAVARGTTHLPAGQQPLANQGALANPQSPAEAKPGVGPLARRLVAPGTGRVRAGTLSKVARVAKTALKFTGAAVGGAALLPVVGAVLTLGLAFRLANEKIIEPRNEARFWSDNSDMKNGLGKPRSNSIVLLPGVLKRVHEHAQDAGRPVTLSEVREMVTMGENIAAAIQRHQGDGPPTISVNGKDVPIVSSTYTVRALSWYMMAQAARQDGMRLGGAHTKTSDMVDSGSFFMKDPGRKIYTFLNSAPTCCSRMSTHVEERSDQPVLHKFLSSLFTLGKISQRGIEDYQSKFPGQGGALLFDKMVNDELYVKFENVGCPSYFKTEKGQGVGAGVCRFFSAFDRNVFHAASFAATRGAGRGGDMVVHQEHVNKGELSRTVNKPFEALARLALDKGITPDLDFEGVQKAVGSHGLAFIKEAIEVIQDTTTLATARQLVAHQGNADAQPARDDYKEVSDACESLREAIKSEGARLGAASDQHGIVRRGGEAHISISNF